MRKTVKLERRGRRSPAGTERSGWAGRRAGTQAHRQRRRDNYRAGTTHWPKKLVTIAMQGNTSCSLLSQLFLVSSVRQLRYQNNIPTGAEVSTGAAIEEPNAVPTRRRPVIHGPNWTRRTGEFFRGWWEAWRWQRSGAVDIPSITGSFLLSHFLSLGCCGNKKFRKRFQKKKSGAGSGGTSSPPDCWPLFSHSSPSGKTGGLSAHWSIFCICFCKHLDQNSASAAVVSAQLKWDLVRKKKVGRRRWVATHIVLAPLQLLDTTRAQLLPSPKEMFSHSQNHEHRVGLLRAVLVSGGWARAPGGPSWVEITTPIFFPVCGPSVEMKFFTKSFFNKKILITITV